MPIAPYLRPDLDQQADVLPLYVTGTLSNAKPGDAYRGELQIHNQIGACTVVSVTGSDVPPGGGWFCEGDKLILSWPAYSEVAGDMENPGFEAGDLSGWTFTTHGGTGTPEISSTQHADGSYSLRWPAQKGLGVGGGVELHAANNTIGVVYPGKKVTASVKMMYNPGRVDYGHGNIQFRGMALLRWLDEHGAEVRISEGKLEKGNAGWYGSWRTLSLSGIAPNGAAGVQLVAKMASVAPGGPSDPNGGVWLDQAQWDAPQVVGINIETTLCFAVTVRDSAGRTAPWSGCVSMALPPTDPYWLYRVTVANLMDDLSDPFRTWVASGGAAVSGGWLNLPGGTGHLSTTNATDFDFGGGLFCIEAFIHLSAYPSAEGVILGKWSGGGGLSFLFGVQPSGRLFLYYKNSSGPWFIDSVGTVPLDTEVHVAVYRWGTSVFSFAIGGFVSNNSIFGSFDVTNQPITVGTQSDGSANTLTGKLRGLRVTKGSTGGYAGTNFTPPAMPLPTS